jgi:hypothetical protein
MRTLQPAGVGFFIRLPIVFCCDDVSAILAELRKPSREFLTVGQADHVFFPSLISGLIFSKILSYVFCC